MNVLHTFHEAMMGLLGQEHKNDHGDVWMTKTHYPLQIGDEVDFRA